MSATTLSPTNTDHPEASRRKWLALAVIAVAQLMVVLDASVVTIALPSAQRALGISTPDRQWVVTAYTLAFGGLLLLGGRIADFRGRKRMFIIGLLGFAAASAIGGAATTSAMLFGARALQGGFAALMAPAALSLISVTFTEPKERATAFGVYGAIAGGGAAVGLILGGVLTQYLSWRWCLYINIPISILAALAARRLVSESRAQGNTRYDIPGTVAVSAGLVSLVYGFTKASTDGWGSPVPLALFAIAAVLLVGFVLIERRTSHPLLPPRIVLNRNRGGSFIGSFLVGVAMLGTFLFMTYYFQGTLHYSALKTGFAFLPFSAGIILGSTLASRFLPRTGPRPIMTIGFLTAAAGLAYMTQWGMHTSFLVHVLPTEALISLGMGFAFVPMSSTALIGAGQHDAGVASATLNTSQQIGGSLGTALLNTIFATAVAGSIAAHGTGPASVAAAQVHGYHVGSTFSAGVLLVAAVMAFSLIKTTRGQGAEAPAAVDSGVLGDAAVQPPPVELVGATD